MTFLDLSKKRYSVRRYAANRPVAEDVLNQILQAGVVAPTAHNNQPFRLYVTRDIETSTATLAECSKFRFQAPVNILITVKEEEAWRRAEDNFNAAEVDSAIVITQMMYAAEERGLGSCWVCAFSPLAAMSAFGVKQGERPISILTIGYPADDSRPGPYHTSRKSIDDLVTYCQ